MLVFWADGLAALPNGFGIFFRRAFFSPRDATDGIGNPLASLYFGGTELAIQCIDPLSLPCARVANFVELFLIRFDEYAEFLGTHLHLFQ